MCRIVIATSNVVVATGLVGIDWLGSLAFLCADLWYCVLQARIGVHTIHRFHGNEKNFVTPHPPTQRPGCIPSCVNALSSPLLLHSNPLKPLCPIAHWFESYQTCLPYRVIIQCRNSYWWWSGSDPCCWVGVSPMDHVSGRMSRPCVGRLCQYCCCCCWL